MAITLIVFPPTSPISNARAVGRAPGDVEASKGIAIRSMVGPFLAVVAARCVPGHWRTGLMSEDRPRFRALWIPGLRRGEFSVQSRALRKIRAPAPFESLSAEPENALIWSKVGDPPWP